MHPLIEENRTAIEDLCRVHGVHRLEVFGSILRDDFDEDRSNVDALVEFTQQAADSFSNFLALKDSLEAVFARSVDLDVQDPLANITRRLEVIAAVAATSRPVRRCVTLGDAAHPLSHACRPDLLRFVR
jgi:uncharacterized protein